jgi:hypothetical protein
MSEQNNIDRLFRQGLQDYEAKPSSKVWDNISREINDQGSGMYNWKRWLAAASFILALVSGLALAFYNSSSDSEQIAENNQETAEQSAINNSVDQKQQDKVDKNKAVVADKWKAYQNNAKQPEQSASTAPQQSGSSQAKQPSQQSGTQPSDANQSAVAGDNESVDEEQQGTPSSVEESSPSRTEEEAVAAVDQQEETEEKEHTANQETDGMTSLEPSGQLASLPLLEIKPFATSTNGMVSGNTVENAYQNSLTRAQTDKEVDDLFSDEKNLMPRGFYVGAFTEVKHSWIINENRFNRSSQGNLQSAFNLTPDYGVTLGYNISDKLSTQVEWSLNSQGQRYKGNISRDVQVNYSRFAALVKLRASKISGKRALPIGNSIVLGPYYSILRSAYIVDIGDPSTAVSDFSTNDYAVVAGLEQERFFTNNMSLTIGVRGHLGLKDIGPENAGNSTNYFNAGVGVKVGLKFLKRCNEAPGSPF